MYLQFIRQVEQAQRESHLEKRDYEDLEAFLTQASTLLEIVKQPIKNRDQEYKVCKLGEVQCYFGI